MEYIWKKFPEEIIKGDNITESGFNYEEEYEKRVYKKVWMDIAWYCGRNGRRKIVLAVSRVGPLGFVYYFFSCPHFPFGGGHGGVVPLVSFSGSQDV